MKKEKYITTKEINDWHQSMTKMVKEIFKKDGYLVPVSNLLCQTNEGLKNIVIELPPMTDDTVKDKISETIKNICKKHNVVALIFITEGWMIHRDKKQWNGERPSESDDRIEIVQISFETPFITKVNIFEIKRDKDKPYLIEIVDDSRGYDDTEGRFAHLLSKNIIKN